MVVGNRARVPFVLAKFAIAGRQIATTTAAISVESLDATPNMPDPESEQEDG